MRWALIRAYDVQAAPKFAPDLKPRRDALCRPVRRVSRRRGSGRRARRQRARTPRPSNFHDSERMAQRSVYGQAGPGGRGALFGGMALASVLLVAVAWAILRASVKLPIGLSRVRGKIPDRFHKPSTPANERLA